MRAQAAIRRARKVLAEEQALERSRMGNLGILVEHPNLSTMGWAMVQLFGYWPLRPATSLLLCLAVERYFKSIQESPYWSKPASATA